MFFTIISKIIQFCVTFIIMMVIWTVIDMKRHPKPFGKWKATDQCKELYGTVPRENVHGDPILALWYVCMSVVNTLSRYEFSDDEIYYLDEILADQLTRWVRAEGARYGISNPRIIKGKCYVATDVAWVDREVQHSAVMVTIDSRVILPLSSDYVVDYVYMYMTKWYDAFPSLKIDDRLLNHVIKHCTGNGFKYMLRPDEDTVKYVNATR